MNKEQTDELIDKAIRLNKKLNKIIAEVTELDEIAGQELVEILQEEG